MTDFDVALRVRLAYEPGAAKTAAADVDAIRASAARLAAQTTSVMPARPMAELGRAAAVAKVSVDDLAAAGARLGAAAAPSRALSADMRAVGAAALDAGRAVKAVEPVQPAGSVPAVDPEAERLQAAIRTRRAAGGFKNGAELQAFLENFAAPSPAAPARLGPGDGASPTSSAAAGQRAVEALGRAADQLGVGAGAEKLAEAVAAVTPAATEARRHVDDIGTAARSTQRDLERMGAAAGGRRGRAREEASGEGEADPIARAGQVWRRRERSEGLLQKGAEVEEATYFAEQRRRMRLMERSAAVEDRRQRAEDREADRRAREEAREEKRSARAPRSAGGGGEAEHGAAHSGPGGIRGALMAGARPLHMERLVMSATTPIGLAGLVGGLGMAEVARQFKAVEDQAISFESAMVGVRRALGDMPDEGMKRVEETILGVSRATGVSKEELAGLAGAALRAGRPLADMPRLLDLGAKAAGVMGIKVDEAGARLVELGRAWGKDEAGIEDTVDAVAAVSEKTGAQPVAVLDFTNRYSGLRARNMSARQVAAFGASFQGAGLDPGQADSAFGALSDKLAHPENAGPRFESDLNLNLGINPTAARVGMRQDPTRTMVGVLEKVKALPEGQRVNVLERMFGAEGGRDIGRVVDHLDDLKRALGLVEDEAQRKGAVDRLFKVFDDTTNAKIERAGRAFDSLAAKIGRGFLPAIGAAADATARYFDQVGRNIDANDRATSIVHKQDRGEALTPDEQRDVDHDPGVRERLGLDPDPAATATTRERERKDALKVIQDHERTARETDDPQIRLMVQEEIRDYRQRFPGAEVPRFATGGRVAGPGGPRDDQVPALLSAGEFVVRASEAAKHHGLLTAINDGHVPAFARGGSVDLSGGVLAHEAEGDGAPARALAHGLAHGSDPDRLLAAVARLAPARDGVRQLTPEAIKSAMAAGSKEGIVAALREMAQLRPDKPDLRPLSRDGADGEADAPERGDGQTRPSLHHDGGGGPGGRGGPSDPAHPRSLRRGGRAGPRHDEAHPPADHPERGDPGLHDDEGRGRHRDQARRHGRARADSQPEGDDASPPPGDGSDRDWSAAILRKKEGFIPKAKWDMNHMRLGFGSDTITDADGHVREVKAGDTVTRADAERDLRRRIPQFQAKLRREVGAEAWDRLDPATKGALTSVGYNYGGFSKLRSLRAAIATGDKHRIAEAVRGLQGHNGGINRQRRLEEASIIETGHLPASWHSREPTPRAPAPERTAQDRPVQPPRAPAADPAPAPPRPAPSATPAPVRAPRSAALDAAPARAARVAALDPIAATPARTPEGQARSAPMRVADLGGATPAGGGQGGGSPTIQNFYGQHDPAATARAAQRERNRSIRQAQAGALHSVGRVA